MNTVANAKQDILQIFLDILDRTNTPYCIVGGLAVNAYVEPVVSLDLDVVMEIKDIDKVNKEAEKKGLKVERFEHSVNLTSSKSDLRIKMQTDSRYQEFLSRASSKEVLGYKMNVGSFNYCCTKEISSVNVVKYYISRHHLMITIDWNSS